MQPYEIVTILNIKARIFIIYELYSDAIKTMKKIKRLISDSPSLVMMKLNSLLFYMALVYEKMDNPNEALKIYNRITKEDTPKWYQSRAKLPWSRGYFNRSLFAIGKIKFDKKCDYTTIFTALKEFLTCMQGKDKNEMKTPPEDYEWEFMLEDIDVLMKQASEMLESICNCIDDGCNSKLAIDMDWQATKSLEEIYDIYLNKDTTGWAKFQTPFSSERNCFCTY